MAETGFSHRLTAYKIVGHFFGLLYRNISAVIRSKIVFFRISNILVPCPHAQLRGRTVIKKLWTFLGPWGRDCSQSPPCCIFRVRQIQPSTTSERTARQSITLSSLCAMVFTMWITVDLVIFTFFANFLFCDFLRNLEFANFPFSLVALL